MFPACVKTIEQKTSQKGIVEEALTLAVRDVDALVSSRTVHWRNGWMGSRRENKSHKK